MPTAAGALVRLNGGQISTSEGPFGFGQEIVGGYAIFNVGSKQEAIDWAKRFMELPGALEWVARRDRSASDDRAAA